jgi:serine acetyltransferase
MVGMPPDFLDIESDPAAEVNRGVFLAHTKVLVVLESLK